MGNQRQPFIKPYGVADFILGAILLLILAAIAIGPVVYACLNTPERAYLPFAARP